MSSRAIKAEAIKTEEGADMHMQATMAMIKSEPSAALESNVNEPKQHAYVVDPAISKIIKSEPQSDDGVGSIKSGSSSNEVDMEELEQLSGKVGIVYIDRSLYPGRAPRAGLQYWINKAWSAELIPTIGAQLQRPEGNQLVLCGWVRRRHNAVILHHLNQGRYIRGRVLETEPWMWGEDQCYWGLMEWEVYTVADNKATTNASDKNITSNNASSEATKAVTDRD